MVRLLFWRRPPPPEPPPPPPPPDNFYKKFGDFLKVFWRAIFSIIWPLIWLPVLIVHFYDNAWRCLYLLIVMAGFWLTECIPLAMTSLLPVIYFPLMGITGTTEICKSYFNASNVMYLGSVMVALALQHSNLHYRIALAVLLCFGCSPRRLLFGIMTITNLLSWWMTNTACTAMMIPIIHDVLLELEKQEMGSIYKQSEDEEGDIEDNPEKRPTNFTIAFFLASCYASTLGGCATLVGTDTNLAYRGLVDDWESAYNITNKESVNFSKFIMLNAPVMIILNCIVWLVLQIMYLGLFRSNSESYQFVRNGYELQDVVRDSLKEKFDELGRMTWHESWVLFLFILTILFWFFREPDWWKGWHLIGQGTEVADAVVCMFMLMLMSLIPKEPICFKRFLNDRDEQPTKSGEGLLNWKILHEQVPWGIMFTIGGGFALARGSNDSKMSTMVSEWLSGLNAIPAWSLMVLLAIGVSFITEFSANVAVANIIIPIVLQVAWRLQIDPIYLTMPTAIACSFAFMSRVGTPPNALAAGFVNITKTDMIKTDVIVKVLSLVVYFIAFVSYGYLFYSAEWKYK